MWLAYLRIAVAMLRGHVFRSALTISSILIGAFSIVLMTSLAESGLSTLAASMEELGGARLISLWRKSPEAMESKQLSYSRGLTRLDVPLLAGIPHVQRVTSLVSMHGRTMTPESGKRLSGDLVGADLGFLPFFHYRLAEGRMLDAEDTAQHARVCVIGHDLADKLWGKGEAVVGKLLDVAGIHCRIVGRLAKLDRWGIGFGWDWDAVLIMPIETLADHEATFAETGRRIFLLTDSPHHNEIVKRIANAVLLERHHGVDDFSIFDFEKRLAGFFRVFLIMKVIVGLLASISLLVGGVGIMNIMLVSVSERVREIGVRKALGASPLDISRQFLVEASLLSGLGGGLGTLVGVLGTFGAGLVIQHFKPRWLIVVSQPAVLVALLAALLIGVAFGYMPAERASKLDPVAAIRQGG